MNAIVRGGSAIALDDFRIAPRRRFALADAPSCGSFGSDPQFQAAWQPIAAQLGHEGQTSGAVAFAQESFCSSLSGLSQQFGVDYADALTAAGNFVTVAHTAQGAIAHVEGLIAAVQSGQPAPAIVSQMAGLVVGVGMAASLIAPGAGAAVMAGIALVGEVLGGIFQGPQGVTVCPGTTCNPAPTFVVNCQCFWDPIVHSPGGTGIANPNWRTFPKPGDVGPMGQPWYGAPGSQARLIDRVFPLYRQLECEQANGWQSGAMNLATLGLERTLALVGFGQAFLGAWKANAEYALNGLQAAADWQVLVQTVRAWNMAHDAGVGLDFPAVDRSMAITAPGIAGGFGASSCASYAGGQVVSSACLDATNPTASCPSLASMTATPSLLVGDVLNGSSTPTTDAPGGMIHINTGALRNVPQTLVLKSTASIATASTPSSPAASSSSTAATVVKGAAVVGAVGAGGVALYAAAHGLSFLQALRALGSKVRLP